MRKILRRPWTPSEIDRAKKLRAEGHSDLEIDRRLDRRPGSTNLKLVVKDPVFHDPSGHNTGGIRAPDHVLAERDVRREASYRRDLTATFCGDPAPGFSELDRRRPHLVKTDREP